MGDFFLFMDVSHLANYSCVFMQQMDLDFGSWGRSKKEKVKVLIAVLLTADNTVTTQFDSLWWESDVLCQHILEDLI